jgi:hypothetical protein
LKLQLSNTSSKTSSSGLREDRSGSAGGPNYNFKNDFASLEEPIPASCHGASFSILNRNSLLSETFNGLHLTKGFWVPFGKFTSSCSSSYETHQILNVI